MLLLGMARLRGSSFKWGIIIYVSNFIIASSKEKKKACFGKGLFTHLHLLRTEVLRSVTTRARWHHPWGNPGTAFHWSEGFAVFARSNVYILFMRSGCYNIVRSLWDKKEGMMHKKLGYTRKLQAILRSLKALGRKQLRVCEPALRRWYLVTWRKYPFLRFCSCTDTCSEEQRL